MDRTEFIRRLNRMLQEAGLTDWAVQWMGGEPENEPEVLLSHPLSNHLIWTGQGPPDDYFDRFQSFVAHCAELRQCQESPVADGHHPIVKGLRDALRPGPVPDEFAISRMLYALVTNGVLKQEEVEWIMDTAAVPYRK